MTLEYEVIDHGVNHGQYFPGCGVAFTKHTEAATGAGSSAKEAGEDALEQFWQTADKDKISVADAEALEREISTLSPAEEAHDDCEHPDDAECELAYYVTIRWHYA